VALAGAILLGASGLMSAEQSTQDGTSEAEVRRLVRRALEYEIEGQTHERQALIAEALSRCPDYGPARWHAGYVRSGDQWVTPEAASEKARRDPRRSQYRARRDAMPGTVLDHTELARWCGKNRLDAEARAHWTHVLEYQPNHKEALTSLGLQWYQGMLLTHEEARQTKARLDEAARAMKHWQPLARSWRRQFERGDSARRSAVVEKIGSITDLAAIPALERELSVPQSGDETPELSLALVTLVGNMTDQAATESLVRHAVLSPWEEVRRSATDQLRRRPRSSFVTLLVAGMKSPIESNLRIGLLPDGTVSLFHRVYCEGALADDSFFQRSYNSARLVRGNGRNAKPLMLVRADMARQIHRNTERVTHGAARIESAVTDENQRRTVLNQRIHSVLTQTTGVQLEAEPTLWWQWWLDENELYYPEEKPVREYSYYEMNTSYVPATTSCFARGTRVWALTGLMPIESIRIGDRVLAQDADTGQLAYKPVLATTLRPPSPMLRITYGEDEVVATLGHPFWVVGEGWRMAKHLKVGDRLQGVGESVRIASIDEAADDEAYNLIVADFSDYFAGAGCVLVHDNTMRQLTGAPLPGLMPE
jgi:hypothetical protein